MVNMDTIGRLELEAAVAQDPLVETDSADNESTEPAFQEIHLCESEDLEAESFLIPVGTDR